MEVDLSPIFGAVISLCAIALTTFGTWALSRFARKLGIEANSEAIQAFDDALGKAIQAGAGAMRDTIAAKGYDHIETKNAILAFALPYAVAKFAPALRSIGLDPDNPAATDTYLRAELNRLFPTAMMPVAASPVTPPVSPPVFPAGSMTTGQLNTASAAG